MNHFLDSVVSFFAIQRLNFVWQLSQSMLVSEFIGGNEFCLVELAQSFDWRKGQSMSTSV